MSGARGQGGGSRRRSKRASLRRIGEVGLRGLGRRLRNRAGERARERRRSLWSETFGAPLDDESLAAFLAADAVTSRGERVLPDLERVRASLLGAAFPFDPEDPGLRHAFARRYPGARDRILEEAEAALQGDLGWVLPGATADWHRTLPEAGHWPRSAAEAIDIGAAQPIGDVRLTWEVGRCTHLLRLAQAAWLSGEIRYARGAVDGLRSFADDNPPGIGVAWLHAQEVAIRANAWLWIARLLRGFADFEIDLLRLWLTQMIAHGSFVDAHFRRAVITNNHVVTELGGLFALGAGLPSLRAAPTWRREALRLLARELRRQLDSEGMSGEFSTHYQAFVADSCVAVVALADAQGLRLPRGMRSRIEGLIDALASLLRHDGSLPAIGDTDAGRVLRLGGDPLDRRGLLAAAAVHFDRPDWGAIAGDAADAFWLSGGRIVPGAESPRPAGGARVFHDAGLGQARTGFGPDAEIAIFRAGPTRLRGDVQTAHAHADALSVGLRMGGADILRDPGTYLYSEGEGWRASLRGTAAHSCVLVDGQDQADVSERFGIEGLRMARWISFEGSSDHLLAEAEHPAGGVPRVRRRVAWLSGGRLVLCDEVLESGPHAAAVWLQLPASTGDVRRLHAELSLGSGHRVLIQGLIGFRGVRVWRPSPGPGPGWAAPRYGTLEAGTAVELEAAGGMLPCRLVTAVQVSESNQTPAPAVAELTGAGGVRVRIGGARIVLPPDRGVRVESGS